MGWYSRFLTKFPYIVILVDILLVVICTPIVYLKHGIPSFGDPTKGFATKGTTIQGRLAAAGLVQEDISNGKLTNQPTVSSSRRKRSPGSDLHLDCLAEYIDDDNIFSFVLEAFDGHSSLMTVEMLKAMCDFERIHILGYFDSFTEDCRLHSVPYYVAGLQNKTCDQITLSDIDSMNNLLVSCSPFYFNRYLSSCYLLGQCEGIPPKCYQQHHVVFKILHFLADKNFLKEGNTKVGSLTYSQIIFRDSWSASLANPFDTFKDYFLDNIEGKVVTSANEKVVSRAMKLRIGFEVFNYYVVGDLPYFALAMGLVLFVIILYMRSIVLTSVILFTVIFSLLLSYFFYYIVFRFAFFPFMNLLAALLLIAVAADDVFIIRGIWTKYAQHDSGNAVVDIERTVSNTLKHGALSIFVTSLTTAAALFANFVSTVTVLKCFSIFAGTCIMINFFFMITWVPAVMVIMEKARAICGDPCKPCNLCSDKLRQFTDKVWNNFFPALVIKVWPLWLVLFLGVGVGGIVLSFVTPKLTLPKSDNLKLFYPDHPFEMYINERSTEFHFERDIETRRRINLEVVIMWGVKEGDHSNVLNPDDEGHYELDPDFNLFGQEGQEWMLTFTTNLLSQPFILKNESYLNFMQVFKDLIQESCIVPANPYSPTILTTIAPCCELNFPLNETMAKLCFTSFNFTGHLVNMVYFYDKTLAGYPIFDKTGTSMRAFIIRVQSNRSSSDINSEMEKHYKEFDDYVMGEIGMAPRGLDKGWWNGRDFYFYDLQNALADGTYIGIGLSLGVGFLVLLVTSMNVFLTAYAIFTIGLAILSTIGILVLVGWELGPFESLSITLSVGLSIDFTIHYGIAYKLSAESTRSARIRDSLSTVGFALLMAAITTFVAGAALMGGRVVGYRNFGIFLMTCMAMSWLFATFFFLPLCRFIGPLGNVGNLMYLFKCKCMKLYSQKNEDRMSRTKQVLYQHSARDVGRSRQYRSPPLYSPNGMYPGYKTPRAFKPPLHNNYNSDHDPSRYYQAQMENFNSPYRIQETQRHGPNSYYSAQSGRRAIPRHLKIHPMYSANQAQGPFGVCRLPRLGRSQSGGYTGIYPPSTTWKYHYQHKTNGFNVINIVTPGS